MAQVAKYDLVVVGAGWNGLAAAKAYLDLHPDSKILIIDSSESIGGTWAKERLYPGLKSNNMVGTYEYSDFPMDEVAYGIKHGQHIPGSVIHKYLSNYAQHFGIYDKIHFNTKVISANRQVQGGGWLLRCSSSVIGKGVEKQIEMFASKLIVAAGLTSEAVLPKFAGDETFGAPLFHCKEFLQNSETLNAAKRVCVLGATKSAWDVAYAYASKGIKVDMVIRESGHGPAWMAPPYVTPLEKWLEKLVEMRFLTWLTPCIWGNFDGFPRARSFLHGTAIGRFIVNAFFWILGNDVMALNEFDSHPEMAKLKPWSDPMFIGAGLSILNYDTDFFEFVRDGTISVHVSDIAELSLRTIHLTNGFDLPADAFICCTGWKITPSIEFIPSHLDLGLPNIPDSSEPLKLIQRADNEILSTFPRLRNQPMPNPKAKPLDIDVPVVATPYRLYRFMVPPVTTRERDIAFSAT